MSKQYDEESKKEIVCEIDENIKDLLTLYPHNGNRTCG